MALKKLDIFNVRNIVAQTLSLSPALNFIYGDNACGKSALLEAIHLLGRAKSFRTSQIKSVISFGQNELIVSAQLLQKKSSHQQLGIRMNSKHVEIRINQKTNQNRSDLAYLLPIQIIHPRSFELLDAGAQVRREFLDWGIFNHDDTFLLIWRKYKKALVQRNALLKTRSVQYIHVWDKELAIYGTMVNEYRVRYLQALKPVLNDTLTRFLTLTNVTVKAIPGWDDSKQLNEILANDLENDLRYGFTQSGPHRGDFQLFYDNRQAKLVASRGQLKLLVICLKLAQVELILKERGRFGCILLDDFTAELDKNNRKSILDYLATMNCQVLITGVDVDAFGDLSGFDDYKLFHMEHGNIKIV